MKDMQKNMEKQILSMNREDMSVLAVRRSTRLVLASSLIYILLTCVLLSPLYDVFSSNTLYQGAWWLSAISIVSDVLQLLLFFTAYSVTIYALWRGGWKKGKQTVIVYALLTVLIFAVNYFIPCLTLGYPLFDEFDMKAVAVTASLELLQYGVIVLLSCIHIRGWQKKQAWNPDGAQGRDSVLPLTSMFVLRNPVQRSAFDMALILLVGGVLKHLIYHVASSEGILWLVVDLVGDLLVAMTAYLVSLLLLNCWHRRIK